MLILSRKENESIKIGDDIEIRVVQSAKGVVKIGIEAPKSVLILRQELATQIKDENLHSVYKKRVQIKSLSEKLKQ